MLKKVISIGLIIYVLLFFLSGCNVHLNFSNYTDYEEYGDSLSSLIDLPYEEIIRKCGEPDLINQLPPEHFNSQGENEAITSVCYKMQKRKLIGFEPTEYCYIGFDPETGLANVIIRPWYLSDK